MIFLIEYNRSEGSVKRLQAFADSEMPVARKAQLERELDLHRAGKEHEVALLEAESELALRRTHRRYFEDLPSLLKPAAES